SEDEASSEEPSMPLLTRSRPILVRHKSGITPKSVAVTPYTQRDSKKVRAHKLPSDTSISTSSEKNGNSKEKLSWTNSELQKQAQEAIRLSKVPITAKTSVPRVRLFPSADFTSKRKSDINERGKAVGEIRLS